MEKKQLIPKISKPAQSKNVKFNYATVITIDPEESVIRFSSMTAGNNATLAVETKKCRTRLFDQEFFDTFKKIMDAYALEHPSAQAAGVTLVVPDRVVATDIISIPTLRRKKTDESLAVAINELYQNADALKINNTIIAQNKQYTSFGLTIMRYALLNALYGSCSTNKMIPQAVTFAANSAVNALQSFMPKLRTASFMFLDIKANYARVSFVSHGRTSGYYQLPFGYTILERNRLAAEDMLIDHSPAELLVLNAQEKAKAKQLTMMQYESASQMAQSMDEDAAVAQNQVNNEYGDNDDYGDESEPTSEADAAVNDTQDVFSSGMAAANATLGGNMAIKTLPKKQPRKLPKFMLREVEHTDEAYTFENFRIFTKWVLNLIQTNRKALWQDKPEGVYVNMPAEFNYLFDMINEEKKENGITFYPIETAGLPEQITANLESYGGFFALQYNQSNNF